MAADSVRAVLEWTGGLAFRAAGAGAEIVLDGSRASGCSPTEALAMALAGCMAIDVVVILQKRRAAIEKLRVEVDGTRAPSEPRRFTRIALRFDLAGSGFTRAHVERAIALSREKYCSVLHSLRTDIDLVTLINLPS